MSERIFRRTPDGNTACQNLELIENRAMRMVLMQVDGIQTEAAIFKKLGQTEEVKRALIELELQGFIYLAPASTLTMDALEPANSNETADSDSTDSDSAESDSTESADDDAAIPSNPSAANGADAKSNELLAKLMAEAGTPTQAGEGFVDPYAPKKKKKKKKKKEDLPPPPPVPVDTRTPEEIEAELKAQEAIFQARRAAFKNAARREAERQARPLSVTILIRSLKTFAVLVVLAILAILFFPYNMLRDQFATQLSLVLERDVQIRNISMEWGESPFLRIQGIHDVEEGKSFEVSEAQVDFSSLIKAWMNGAQWGADTTLKLNGVQLEVADLLRFTDSWKLPTADHRTPFNVWQLNNVTLQTPHGAYTFANAEIQFSDDGELKEWRVFNAETGWEMRLMPTNHKGKLNVDFQALDWKPLGPKIPFIGVSARGVLTKNGLDLPKTDAGVFEGRLDGHLKINWKKGWTLDGAGDISVMALRRIGRTFAPGLPIEGSISGKVKFESGKGVPAKTWNDMWRELAINFNLIIYNGQFVSPNLPDLLRNNQVALNTPIRFAKMQTRGEWKNKALSARIINLASSQLVVNSDFTISPDMNVQGMWITDINSQVMRRELKIQLSGKIPQIQAVLLQDRSH